MSTGQRRPPIVVSLDVRELLEEIRDRVDQLGTEQTKMQGVLGASGPEGKGGTGLVGEVLGLKAKMEAFMGLKSLWRGILIGGVVVAALLLLGPVGALKALGTAITAVR